MRKSLIAVVLAFSAVSSLAHAAPNNMYERATLDVPYSDLNLASHAGAAAMLTRIKNAADRVCGGNPRAYEFKQRAAYKACMREAIDNAVRQLRAPLVTALHMGRAADPRVAYEGR